MDAAKQLRNDTIPFVPRALSASTAPPLQIAMNPFVAGASGSRIGRPLQTAFGEVVRQIGLQTAIVVVVGSAGTGKSSLMDMTARACLEMGLSVRRVERGDQVHMTFGAKSDVLLVDQTDSMSNSSLQTLLSADGKNTATTIVFMCLPTSVCRFNFSDTDGAIIELTPLALSDSRNYLQERATSIGRANLFTPEALDLVIDGSRGLPRLLRSIAHLAFFAAASEGASQIGAQHVSNASEARRAVGHSADADGAGNPGQSDSASRIGPKPGTDSLTPRVPFENEKRDTDTTAQSKFGIGTKETDRPLPIRHKNVADAPEFWVAPNTVKKRDDGALSALSGWATAEAAIKAPPIPPAPKRLPPENVSAKPVKEFRQLQQRSADVWIPRAAGITGALVATVAVAVVLPWMLMSGKPNDVPHAAIAPLTITRPVDSTKAAVQTPALAKQTASLAKSPPQAPARSDTAVANSVVTKPAAPAQAKAEVSVKTPVVTNTAVQPTREVSASGTAAPGKPVDDKARTETADANRIKAVGDQTPSVVNAAEPTARGNDAAEQAAAVKAAEDKAAEQRVATERADAAVQAFLQAQEAGRQAKAARDAADRAKAEQDAKAERQDAIRVFSNSLRGVGR